jgi:hypothetical protein
MMLPYLDHHDKRHGDRRLSTKGNEGRSPEIAPHCQGPTAFLEGDRSGTVPKLLATHSGNKTLSPA